MHSFKPVSLSLVLLLATAMGAQAHMTVESDGAPVEVLVPGVEYIVSMTGYVHCSVMGPSEDATAEYHEGQVLTLSIVESGDYSWLNASTVNETLSFDRCEPVTEGGAQFQGNPLYGPQVVMPNDITFTVAETAPAFETFNFQPGAFGETNEGGNFTAQIAYNPAFTAPTALAFDAVAGGATATIPLVMAANADSTFTFDVTSFTIDGENVAGGAMAHIQETLDVATGIATEEGTTTKNVELHFGGPGEGFDHEEGHDEMAMDEGDDEMAMEGEDHSMDHGDHDDESSTDHVHWEAAEITLAITLAAQEDATLVSEPQEVLLTIHNTDSDTLPHDEGAHGDAHSDENGETNFLPGFEVLALVAALAAVAVLRRRD